MKKIGLICGMAVMLMACGRNSSEYKQLQQEKDSLVEAQATQAAELKEALALLNEVEENFEKLREAENFLTAQSNLNGELSKTQRERIADNFELVHTLLKKNKEELDNLQKKTGKDAQHYSELQKTIVRLQKELESKAAQILALQQQLGEKDEQIRTLSGSLADLSIMVDSLALRSEQQGKALDEKNDLLNTAWYIFGTRRELKAQKVLDGKKLLQGNYDKEKFIKIDIRTETEIPLYAKRARVLTSHPEASYELVKGTDKALTLVIRDYQQFWEASRFLVIEVD